MTRLTRALSWRYLIVAPAFLEWDLGTYLWRLLRDRDVEVERFAYRGRHGDVGRSLIETVRAFRPDVVLGLKMAVFSPRTLTAIREHGCRVALWYVDCFGPRIPPRIAALVPQCDAVFLSAKGMVPAYEALSKTTVRWVHEGVYLPAFPDVESTPGQRGLYGSQVAFVGNLLHPPVPDEQVARRRLRLLRAVGERFALKIWGPQGDPQSRSWWREEWGQLIPWPAYHEELVKICRTTDVVLGLNTVNDVELYFSNRTFLTLACGGFHLTHYVPGLETMFENHRHLVWYRCDEECLELIEHYLRRPEQRQAIARQGRSWTRRRYGMRRQLNRILRFLDEAAG